MPTFSHRLATLAFAASLLALTACSKDDDSSAPTQPGVASWILEGQKLTSSTGYGDINFDRLDIYIYQEVTISNSKGVGLNLELHVPMKVGTYTIGSNSIANARFADPNTYIGIDPYSADAGYVTVSTLTASTVSGTFAFTGKSLRNNQLTKRVTDGKFTINIQD